MKTIDDGLYGSSGLFTYRSERAMIEVKSGPYGVVPKI